MNNTRTFTKEEKQALNEFFNTPEIRESVEKNDYENIYRTAHRTFQSSVVTDFLLQHCNINPLLYMNYVPRSFAYRSNIKSINIPNNIESIGVSAFDGCKELTNIVIPDKVTIIGSYAFFGCINLTSIILGKSVERIYNQAFFNCRSLTDVTIPDKVITTGEETFKYCINLKNIVLGKSLTRIDDGAFSDCSELESITIGERVESIENYAFWDCPKLKNVYYQGSKEDWDKIKISNLGNSDLFNAQINFLKN